MEQCKCDLDYGKKEGLCNACKGSRDPHYGVFELIASASIKHCDKGLQQNTLSLFEAWFRLNGHLSMANGMRILIDDHARKMEAMPKKEPERILLE